MRSQRSFLRCFFWIIATVVPCSTVFAQFGGRPGDVVIYAVTAKGNGDFQVVPPLTTNNLPSAANFRVTPLDSVPDAFSDPFPIVRKVLYEQPDELFQVSTDAEGNIGLHRTFLAPTKLFSIEGTINTIGDLLGQPNNFIAFPQGLDVELDVVLARLMFVNWAPTHWPFLQVVTQRGPVGPPDLPGWVYLFQLPNAVKLPSLMAWVGLSEIYPSAGWQWGVDLKMLEIDPAVGSTIRQLRLRPGKQTPLFRIPGHTHLLVLQGGVTITPARSAPIVLKKYDYVYVPQQFAITLSNPIRYEGPGAVR
jgi:hypothetical protein